MKRTRSMQEVIDEGEEFCRGRKFIAKKRKENSKKTTIKTKKHIPKK